MPQYQGNLHKRKPSGGRRKRFRKKRKYEIGGDPVETTVGERSASTTRMRGGKIKLRLLKDEYANVYDPRRGEMIKAKIIKVEKNPANKDYDRRGVITKGTIIITEGGRALVTSRPGQDGVINARIIES
ncbi:MAG: 30S ribosomal protein S8e [Candidatus Geothermarchaeales archaeon]